MRTIVVLMLLLWGTFAVATEAPRPFVSGSMAQILDSVTGRPAIVSFWSVDCPPCYRELSLWAELSKRHPQLQLVLVSADAQELQQDVQEVLQETGAAALPSWQFADPFAERLRFEVDGNWHGELPRTYLISPNGRKRGISGVISAEQVEEWLRLQAAG